MRKHRAWELLLEESAREVIATNPERVWVERAIALIESKPNVWAVGRPALRVLRAYLSEPVH